LVRHILHSSFIVNYQPIFPPILLLGYGGLVTGGAGPTRLYEVDLAYETSCGTGQNPVRCVSNLGKSVCHGDSGGLLYDMNVNPIVLVGVSSVRFGNCGEGSGFARIAGAFLWIKSTICVSHSSPMPAFCGTTPNGTWGSIRCDEQ
jgi:hypothetical protein